MDFIRQQINGANELSDDQIINEQIAWINTVGDEKGWVVQLDMLKIEGRGDLKVLRSKNRLNSETAKILVDSS